MFRMSRASLLARLPLYCSAECATPKNSSLFANFSRNLANAPLPPESFRTCFVCATHAHSRSIGFCAIWVCISPSSSSDQPDQGERGEREESEARDRALPLPLRTSRPRPTRQHTGDRDRHRHTGTGIPAPTLPVPLSPSGIPTTERTTRTNP